MVPHRVGGSETLVKSTANLSTLLQSPMGLAADGWSRTKLSKSSLEIYILISYYLFRYDFSIS